MKIRNPALIARAAFTLTCVVGLGFVMQASPAFALDGKVYSPQVVEGEAEIEYAGTDTFDASRDKNNIQEHQFSIGYGLTDWWLSEFYFANFERGPDQPSAFSGTEFENIFQFWPTGKYWLDAGLLASYHFATLQDAADSAELKLLLQKDIGRVTALINFGGEHEVGNHAMPGADLSSAINARYRWLPYFEPGIEFQSDYGNWNDHLSFDQQEHYLGPILYGRLMHNLKYEAGYFRGISAAAASSAMRLKLEYEFFF